MISCCWKSVSTEIYVDFCKVLHLVYSVPDLSRLRGSFDRFTTFKTPLHNIKNSTLKFMRIVKFTHPLQQPILCCLIDRSQHLISNPKSITQVNR